MIERRFIKSSRHENLPVHVVQAVFAQILTGDMTQGEALAELNNSVTESLNPGEQADLQDILGWIAAGPTTTEKIVRWHRIESTLMLARAKGPKYGEEFKLRPAIENMIGKELY